MLNPRLGLVLVLLTLATACTSAPTRTDVPPTTGPDDPALAAYEEFWSITRDAFAAPTAQDWTTRASDVATGQALDALRADIENYASLPAHVEGAVNRNPQLGTTTVDRVQIVDCVDLGDSRLVSDRTGEVLDDLANRVPRYRYRAEVVNSAGRWLVERTEPSLDEPC